MVVHPAGRRGGLGMIDTRTCSPLPDDAPELAATLAEELPGVLETTDAAEVVACWTDHEHADGEAVAAVTLGSPHVIDGPIFQVTIRRVHPAEAERLRRHLGEVYDDGQASFWDEEPDAFRAKLADGHLYDAYRPWPGGPAWPHRADHERWAAEQCAEADARHAERLAREAEWDAALGIGPEPGPAVPPASRPGGIASGAGGRDARPVRGPSRPSPHVPWPLVPADRPGRTALRFLRRGLRVQLRARPGLHRPADSTLGRVRARLLHVLGHATEANRMIHRPADRPERVPVDELAGPAERRLLVVAHRALTMLAKGIAGYLDETRRVDQTQRSTRDAGPPGRSPGRPSV